MGLEPESAAAGPPTGPPPFPPPGGEPGSGWKWNPDPCNSRGGTWGPEKPIGGQSQPTASWDPEGHWDVDDGKGNRQRYDKEGNPITPEEAHGKETKSNPNETNKEETIGEKTARVVKAVAVVAWISLDGPTITRWFRSAAEAVSRAVQPPRRSMPCAWCGGRH